MKMVNMAQSKTANPLCDLARVEDYLEVVYDLIQTKGYARAVEIAQRLDVKTPSLTNMIQKLDGMGLVVYERYRGLTLTEKGEKMARFTQQKHALIVKFLRILGIEEKTANEDAEGIEHHVHKDTLKRIERFVDFVSDHPSWFKTFEKS
jgi:Mn-dependent DtxR family transcriptional regulator